jgi:hypothetical protein
MPKTDQMSSSASLLAPADEPELTPEASDFLREHELQEDLVRYYHVLEKNFPQAKRISFQLQHDPEIEGLQFIEATVTIRGLDLNTIMQYQSRYVHDFCNTVTHDHQPYFVLDLDLDR